MKIARLYRQSGEQRSFGRAKFGLPTLVLLAVLRFYALCGVAIAVYAFFRALQ